MYVLSIIQVYMYALMALFHPLLWWYPTAQLMGRLESRWIVQGASDPVSRAISMANLILVMPAYWMELWWHTIIAYALFCLGAYAMGGFPSHCVQHGLKLLVAKE